MKIGTSAVNKTVESSHVNADISMSVGEVRSITSAVMSRAHGGLWSHRSTWRCKAGWTGLSNRLLPSETLLFLGCFKVLLSRYHTLHHKRIALCRARSKVGGWGDWWALGGGDASLRIKPGSGVWLDFLRTTPFNDQLQL